MNCLQIVTLLGCAILLQGIMAKGSLEMSLSLKDLGPTKHACSKAAFTKCENKFQNHVEAVAAFKDDLTSDKQDLWCEVLSSHKTCMGEVLDSCLVDYPKLSKKVQGYLEDVVHKGCTHEGPTTVDISKSCVHTKLREKRSVDESKNLYELANECLENDGQLDPTLQSLMTLLHNLNRSREHLYKRLPDV
ncbi:uncharacterized protein [Watersipora subatra]|uniref:uncharacterized protein n=1 Tax=Watersipora subatra TaxID=2589382 RepID=UPI00355C4150